MELASKSLRQSSKHKKLPSSIFEESDSSGSQKKQKDQKYNNEYLLSKFNDDRPLTQSDAFTTQYKESQEKPQTSQTDKKRIISQKLHKISSMASNPLTPYLAKQSDLTIQERSLYDPRASFYLQCTSHQKLQPEKMQSYSRINDFYEECQNESKIMYEENSGITRGLNDIESQWRHYAFQLKSKEIDGKTSSEFQGFIEQREFKRKLIQYLLRQLDHNTKLMIMKKYMDSYEKNPDTVIPVQYNYKNMPNMEAFLSKNALNIQATQIMPKWFKNYKKPKKRNTDIYEEYLQTSGQLASKIKSTSELIKRTNEIIRSANPKP